MPDGSSGTRHPKNKAISKRRRGPSIGLMALEPRLMYDGAAAATATAAAATQPHSDASAGASAGASSAPAAPSSAAPAADHAADHPSTPAAAPSDSSSTGTPADSSTGGGTAGAPATASSATGHQIVFIDGNVPDAQALAQGVQPGIEVVILDPNSNGVQQIADYLTSHNEQNLDAIQIVSHGEDATVRLGNTIFGLADISMFSQQLATWGHALKQGGDILFYGCNVGEGTAGALFEIELSQATGGAHVAASSGLVGAASLGGSWTLDVADGTIDVGNPFAAATLAQYNNVLTNQIWFSEQIQGNTVDDQIAHVNGDGSTLTSVFNATQNSGSSYLFTGIALDAADGVYFAVNLVNASTPDQIVRGSISGGTPTVIWTAQSTADNIHDVVYSPTTGLVYFSQVNGPTNAGTDTGIYKITNPTAASPTVTRFIAPSSDNLVNPDSIAIDAQDNLLFFSDFSSFGSTGAVHSPTARIEVANLTTGAILNTALQTINTSSSGQLFFGIDVDPTNNKLYWITNDISVGANNEIFSATYSTGATPTLSGVTNLYTAPSGSPAFVGIDITVDSANGVYYAVLGGTSGAGKIVEGNLTPPNPANPSPLFTLPLPSGFTIGQAKAVELEIAPVLSVTGSPNYVLGGSAVDLSSSVTVTDIEQNIASATVTIGGKQTGDALAATTAGTSITASYNSSTGVLTLSGVDSAAHYQSVLDSVTFSTTSTASTSRTFSWSTTDGNLASNTGSTSATVHVLPVVTAGATATFNGGGSAVALDATLNVTDASSTTLTGATISIGSGFLSGDTLNFTTQNGITGSYNSGTGVLTLSGTTTVANYKTALESITYSFTAGGDPTNAGADTSRTINWTVNDGVASSTAVTSTLNTVHTAPVVTASGTVSFTGGSGPVALDSGLALADVDSAGKLASATVSISSGFQSGIDTLSVNGQVTGTIAGTSIAVSYNASTGVLTLTGTDTIAHYQAALDVVQYSTPANADPTNGGTHTSRTISWSVKDGSTSNGTSNTGSSTLNTVHAAPVLSVAGSPQYAAGGSATVLDSTLTVTDSDSGGNLNGATVKITTGLATGDILAATTAGTGITASYVAGTGTLTLSGVDTLAHYQQVLQSITYSSSASDPTSGGTDTSRTIQWTVTDGSSSNGSSTGSLTLGVTSGPSIVAGASVSFLAGGSPVTLDSVLTVSDGSITTLTGATVKITGNFLSGDTLAATTAGTSITASYNGATGILTLSGSDSLAHYQTVLDSVTYSSSAADPTGAGTKFTRTISWAASDSNSTGTAATSTVNVHTPPVVTAGTVASYTAGGGAVTLDSGLTLSDAETANAISGTVSISGGFQSGDVLHFTNQNGITGSYNAATGVLTLSGTASVANYQTALDSIAFSTSGSNITSNGTDRTRTVSWQVADDKGIASNTSTSLVTVNDPPVVTPSGANSTFNAGGPAVTLDSGLTLTDHEASQVASATVSITGNFLVGDTLAATTTGTTITAVYNGATGVLTLSGTDTVAHYQTVLDSIAYSSTAADPTGAGSHLSRTVSFQVTDVNGVLQVASNTAGVTVGVHSPPVVTAGATATFTAGGGPVTLDSSLTLSDAESTTLTGATITIGSHQTGDTLNFTNQNGISGSYNSTTGVLTLAGTATVANYQAALDSITYSSSSGDPSQGGTVPTRTVSWSVQDSVAGSNTATSTLITNAGTPLITGTSGVIASYFAGGVPVTLDASLAITDPASTTLSGATVTITNNLLGDTLTANTTGTAITALYDRVHGVLMLSGSDTVANYQAVLDGITYSSAAPDPAAGGSAPTRTISWQVNDGSHLSPTVTTTVNDSHVAPEVTADGSPSFQPGNGAVLLDPTVTVADAGPDPITFLQVKITAGRVSGDTLAFNGGASTMVFGDGSTLNRAYDASTGTLTLTVGGGSPTTADFQLAARTITFDNPNATPGNPGGTRTMTWTVGTANPSETSAGTTSTIVPPAPPPPNDASSFAPGSPGPGSGSSGFLFTGTSSTSSSSTSSSGPSTSGAPSSGPFGTASVGSGSFGFGAFGFDMFSFSAGTPSYFDPGGGFGTGFGFSFSNDFGAASYQLPVDPATPITAVADATLDIGFDQKIGSDQKTGQDVDDAVAAAPAKPIAVAVADRDGLLRLMIDNGRLAGPDVIASAERLVPADAPPAAGKLGLSAQLRAAGRQGFLHDRQALLKSLHDSVRG